MNTKRLTCKLGENSHLLKNERFMAQNAFVICGLMEAVLIAHERKQEGALNHVYGKRGNVDVLNVDYGSLEVESVVVDSKIANDHVVTVHINPEDTDTASCNEDILERFYGPKEISSLLTPCIEPEFQEELRNDMINGFTFAEFQVASSNRKNKAKIYSKSFDIKRSAKMLSETLGQEGVGFDVIALVEARQEAVLDRITEITHGQGFLR